MASNPTRKRAVERYANGDKLAQIASDSGVHPSIVVRWAKQAGIPTRRSGKPINSYKYDYERKVAREQNPKGRE